MTQGSPRSLWIDRNDQTRVRLASFDLPRCTFLGPQKMMLDELADRGSIARHPSVRKMRKISRTDRLDFRRKVGDANGLCRALFELSQAPHAVQRASGSAARERTEYLS